MAGILVTDSDTLDPEEQEFLADKVADLIGCNVTRLIPGGHWKFLLIEYGINSYVYNYMSEETAEDFQPLKRVTLQELKEMYE